jgi:molybdopterin molybdotransferase
MSLLPVDEAIRRLLAGVTPVASESAPLAEASGRVLAGDLAALRTQPPFPASAMDGYAVRAAEATAGARLAVIGTSRAGERFKGVLGVGQAVRIFTGAPLPEGADAILIQEDAEALGDQIVVREGVAAGRYRRPEGLDFRKGDLLLVGGVRLNARALALAAATGHAKLLVRRRPVVAVLSNGDELVPPGQAPGPDQIISSNGVALCALVAENGGEARDLGIAPDRREAIIAHVDRAAGADVLVVIGGASVGEHDLVRAALVDRGMQLDFWRIAMRPGKPLLVGRIGDMRVLGLPGNPVSALVCGYVFLRPLIRALLGLDPAAKLVAARLGRPMPPNDQRQDYVRARLSHAADDLIATAFDLQDSSMLATLARADALIVRPPHAPAAAAGERISVLPLGD